MEAILEAAEKGRPVPVFTQSTQKSVTSSSFSSKKAFDAWSSCVLGQEEGNVFFKAGEYVKAGRLLLHEQGATGESRRPSRPMTQPWPKVRRRRRPRWRTATRPRRC